VRRRGVLAAMGAQWGPNGESGVGRSVLEGEIGSRRGARRQGFLQVSMPRTGGAARRGGGRSSAGLAGDAGEGLNGGERVGQASRSGKALKRWTEKRRTVCCWWR
jgi:hypothetical protein